MPVLHTFIVIIYCVIMPIMERPELLAPAGNMEKLKTAIHFGADAVYLSGKMYGLRAAAGNFSYGEMKEGVEYAHKRGVKVYATVNIFFHNNDIEGLPEYLDYLGSIGIDAVIISDPGVVALAQEIIPDMEIHISTQANTTNWRGADFWKKNGAARVNLARELSLEEIRELKTKTAIEIETFVHGAVCMAYSGRCHLSSHMTGRNANYGDCTHSCRWEYTIKEAKRPSEEFDVEEDQRGTYFFNSKDLCMIEHIPALISAGIDSLKIEGRAKGVNYVAGTVRSYRLALDSYFENPEKYGFNQAWLDELQKLSHRNYDTGSFFGKEGGALTDSSYIRSYDFVGVAKKRIDENRILIEARNKLEVGDVLEILGKSNQIKSFKLDKIIGPEGEDLSVAQPGQLFFIETGINIEPLDILRKQKEQTIHGDKKNV